MFITSRITLHGTWYLRGTFPADPLTSTQLPDARGIKPFQRRFRFISTGYSVKPVMPSTPSASRRPYRSHKTPACDRCRRFKRRCTGGGPSEPCVLCKLQNVPCQPSDIAKAHTPSRRSTRADYTLPRRNQVQEQTDPRNPSHPSPVPPHVRNGLGDSESNDHNAIHLGDAKAESSIVVSPVLTEDIQALERYFSSGSPAGDSAPTADGLDKSLVYMKVPRRREGLAMAKNPGKFQKEVLWQILRPFAKELVKL